MNKEYVDGYLACLDHFQNKLELDKKEYKADWIEGLINETEKDVALEITERVLFYLKEHKKAWR